MSFPDLDESKVICLKEGGDHRMDFMVTSDPLLETQSGHFLSKQGGSTCSGRVYIRGKTVYLKKVRKGDSGTYTVSTFNAAGEGQYLFKLRIKCKLNCTRLLRY